MKRFHCKSLEKVSVSRRTMLSAGGMGMLGMNVPDFLRANELASAQPTPFIALVFASSTTTSPRQIVNVLLTRVGIGSAKTNVFC